MTIHNIGYQGVFARRSWTSVSADAYLPHLDDLKAGHINALKHGIPHADAVTTVSPTYAREITTPRYGMGMEQALASRGSGARSSMASTTKSGIRRVHLPIHFGPERRAEGRARRNFRCVRMCRRGRVPLAS
jgi:hypothetical protein